MVSAKTISSSTTKILRATVASLSVSKLARASVLALPRAWAVTHQYIIPSPSQLVLAKDPSHELSFTQRGPIGNREIASPRQHRQETWIASVKKRSSSHESRDKNVRIFR